MKRLNREDLRQLLLSWERREISTQGVHEAAESLLETCDVSFELSRGDPRSIEAEVLSQLDILNHQWITRDDIPTFLQFLAAKAGEEERAWAQYTAYWQTVDFGKRKRDLAGHHYYGISKT